MAAGEVSALSKAVFETFQKHRDELFPESALESARAIALYFPIRGEVDTRLFFSYFRKTGKTCFFPKTFSESAGAGTRIEFHPVKDWSELRLGRFGIAEPNPSVHAAPAAAALDLILVPGVAFDLNGHRLGYGAGYYDRAIAKIREERGSHACRLIGLAYDFQILPALPAEPHDVALDAVISEKRVILPPHS